MGHIVHLAMDCHPRAALEAVSSKLMGSDPAGLSRHVGGHGGGLNMGRVVHWANAAPCVKLWHGG